jgi:hypothetical protein
MFSMDSASIVLAVQSLRLKDDIWDVLLFLSNKFFVSLPSSADAARAEIWSQIRAGVNPSSLEPGYICLTCAHFAKNRRDLYEHVESKHVEGAGHNCPVCDKFCRSRNGLRTHMCRYHGSSKASQFHQS